MKTLIIILACLVCIFMLSGPPVFAQQEKDQRDPVVSLLRLELSNLEAEQGRLKELESQARIDVSAASKNLRLIRKRLGKRRISILTVDESARLQAASQDLAIARSRLH